VRMVRVDCHRAPEAGHLFGQEHVRPRRAVSELTPVVLAPGPDRAISSQRETVELSPCRGGNTCQAPNPYRLQLRRSGLADADLPVRVVAPGPERPVGLD